MQYKQNEIDHLIVIVEIAHERRKCVDFDICGM